MTSSYKKLLLITLLLLAGVGVVLYQSLAARNPAQSALLSAGIVLLPQPRALPELSLTNQDNQSFQVRNLGGKWTLVSFGYTFCPDICPTTLAELKRLQGLLPERSRAALQVVMVSVDPNRDTAEQLKRYLAYFNPEFMGLTGPLADIQRLSATLGIPFVPGDTQRDAYTVDHSGNLAIIGPDARLRGFVRAPLNVPALAAQLPSLMEGN